MSIPNAERLTYPFQRVKGVQVNTFPKITIASGSVGSTPSTASYPLAQLEISTDGNQDLIKQGMMVEFSRDGVIYYRGTVRKDYSLDTPNTLFIGGISVGDGGILGLTTPLRFASGDSYTVYATRTPFSFWSRISPTDSRALKKWDENVRYEDAPALSKNAFPRPVVNLGAWQRGVVDSNTGYARLTHSASASTVWRGTGFTVEWTLPAGATLVSGYNLDDVTIEVDYEEGAHIIECEVTEVGGANPARKRKGYRYVWAISDTYQDTSNQEAIEIEQDEQDERGRTVVLRVTGATDPTETWFIGAPVLMTSQVEFSDDMWETSVSVPEANRSFAGYVSQIGSVQSDGQVYSFSVTVVNLMTFLDNTLPIATQVLNNASNANRWYRTVPVIGNLSYFCYYLLEYHAPFVMDLHDFDASALAEFKRPSYSIDKGSIYRALQEAAGLCLGATVGVTSEGKVLFKRNPSVENSTYINALGIRTTVDADWVAENLSYERTDTPSALDVEGAFTITQTDPLQVRAFVARARYGAQGLGNTEPVATDFIALSKEDGRERVGRWLSVINSPVKALQIRTTGVQDVFDPCEDHVYTVQLDDYDAYNTGLLNSTSWVVKSVTREWDNSDTWIILRLVVQFAPITRGQRAKIVPQPPVVTPPSIVTVVPPTTTTQPQVNVIDVLGDYRPVPDSGGGIYIDPSTFDWAWEYDFTEGTQGFTDYFLSPSASWQNDVGFNQVYGEDNSGVTDKKWRFIGISRTMDLSNARGAYVYYTVNQIGLNIADGVAAVPAFGFHIESTGSPITWSIGSNRELIEAPSGFSGAEFFVLGYIGWWGVVIPISGVYTVPRDPEGLVTITRIILYGVGTPDSSVTSNGNSIAMPSGGSWDGDAYTPLAGQLRSGVDIIRSFNRPRNIRRIYIQYDLTIGTVVDDDAWCFRLFNVDDEGEETLILSQSFAQMTGAREGTNKTYTLSATGKINGLRVCLSSSLVYLPSTPDGTVKIREISWDEVS